MYHTIKLRNWANHLYYLFLLSGSHQTGESRKKRRESQEDKLEGTNQDGRELDKDKNF